MFEVEVGVGEGVEVSASGCGLVFTPASIPIHINSSCMCRAFSNLSVHSFLIIAQLYAQSRVRVSLSLMVAKVAMLRDTLSLLSWMPPSLSPHRPIKSQSQQPQMPRARYRSASHRVLELMCLSCLLTSETYVTSLNPYSFAL